MHSVQHNPSNGYVIENYLAYKHFLEMYTKYCVSAHKSATQFQVVKGKLASIFAVLMILHFFAQLFIFEFAKAQWSIVDEMKFLQYICLPLLSLFMCK